MKINWLQQYPVILYSCRRLKRLVIYLDSNNSRMETNNFGLDTKGAEELVDSSVQCMVGRELSTSPVFLSAPEFISSPMEGGN